MSAPVSGGFFLYVASEDWQGRPDLTAYGPFDSQESADEFAAELFEVHIHEGRRVYMLLHPLVEPTAPDDAWWRDPELLDDAR